MSGSFSLSDFLTVEESHFGRKARGLRRWDARLKLALCAALILVNVLLARRHFSLAVLSLSWIGLLWTRVAWRQAFWFIMAPLWATSLVVIGFGVGFGHSPLLELGPLTLYREGLIQGLDAGLRVLAEMACAAALVLSTPFAHILAALRWFRVPEILVETLAFMYRYIFLLWDEAQLMREAAATRGGLRDRKASLATLGQIVAHMFLRAYDRSQRVALAMRARGGEGA